MSIQSALRCISIAVAVLAGCRADSSEDGGQPEDARPGPDLTTTDLPTGPEARDSAAATCNPGEGLITSDGECNSPPYPTRRVPFTVGTGSPPTFTGGTLVDGLYTAIKAEGWNVATGAGRQMGIVLMNGGKTLLWFGQTLNADGTGDAEPSSTANGLAWLRANFDLSVKTSNTLTLTKTCGTGTAGGPPELLYTMTTTDPPQLILANPQAADPTSAVTTYERQGCPTTP
jgi:hypothetical protein